MFKRGMSVRVINPESVNYRRIYVVDSACDDSPGVLVLGRIQLMDGSTISRHYIDPNWLEPFTHTAVIPIFRNKGV